MSSLNYFLPVDKEFEPSFLRFLRQRDIEFHFDADEDVGISQS